MYADMKFKWGKINKNNEIFMKSVLSYDKSGELILASFNHLIKYPLKEKFTLVIDESLE